MTRAQECLFVLAHVLLGFALAGTPGPLPPLLASGGALASLLGLARAVGPTPRRRP